MRNKSRFLTESALFAALISILAPLAIPVGPIPVTLGVFAVLFTAVVLNWKHACAAVGVYLLLGMIGLPVFSAGKSGPAVFIGATGGYLWTFLPMAALVAWLCGREWGSRRREEARTFFACILALLFCYACGTIQFMAVANVRFGAALASCVYPFVIFDLIKCAAAAVLGVRVRRKLQKI